MNELLNIIRWCHGVVSTRKRANDLSDEVRILFSDVNIELVCFAFLKKSFCELCVSH